MALNIQSDAEWAAVQSLLHDMRTGKGQAPFAAPAGSEAVVKLKAAIVRVREQGGQPKWKCGECNGWTGYFCPNHQAIGAMEAALKVIEPQNDKLTDAGTQASK